MASMPGENDRLLEYPPFKGDLTDCERCHRSHAINRLTPPVVEGQHRYEYLCFLCNRELEHAERSTASWAAPPCDCIHGTEWHDPATGACLVTNPRFGPCPCAATPEPTRATLERAFRFHRAAERLAREHSG